MYRGSRNDPALASSEDDDDDSDDNHKIPTNRGKYVSETNCIFYFKLHHI